MRNIRKVFALAVIGTFLINGNVHADAFVKFGRGLTNLVTSPAELFCEPFDLAKTNNLAIAWIGGIPKGLLFFPIPFPNHYEPLMEPETLIEGFNPE